MRRGKGKGEMVGIVIGGYSSIITTFLAFRCVCVCYLCVGWFICLVGCFVYCMSVPGF